jgi:hypothetical protein
LEQEPSERGDPGATPRRDHGLPFHHPYFRLGESTWRISADALGLALVMIRTPYTRNYSTPKSDNLFVLYLFAVAFSVLFVFDCFVAN